jgi:hypothetical protein
MVLSLIPTAVPAGCAAVFFAEAVIFFMPLAA